MRRITALFILAAAVGLVGCAGFRAERNGKDFGQAVCDFRTADNSTDRQDALKKAQDSLSDAKGIKGHAIDEDIDDIKNNIGDLKGHVEGGNQALARQDVEVIRRNVNRVIKTTTGRSQRFFQGVAQGLSECADDN